MEDQAQEQEAFVPSDLGSLFGQQDTEAEVEVEAESEVPDNEETETVEANTETEVDAEQTDVEKDSSSESGENKNERTVPLGALTSERGKRQALEEELAALKSGKVAEVAPEPAAIASAIPSIYDGEGQFQEGVSSFVKKEVGQAIFNDRLQVSQSAVVKELGEDVVQVALDTVTKAMTNNPKLVERFRASQSPFQEIMVMAKELGDAERFNNPALVEDWKAEQIKLLTASITANLVDKQNSETELDDSIPDSLSGTRSSGSLKAGKFTGQKSLDQILN